MNYRLLCKVLGLLLLLLSITMLSCLGYAYYGDNRQLGIDAVDAFWISISVTFAFGIILCFLGRKSGREVMRREAVAIVGLGWIMCALFGALPYVLCTPGLPIADALFESMSGFTTTGATVIEDLDTFPRSILLWRALTQWLGGLGILVLFVALLSYLGVGSKALFRHESSANSGDGTQARIRSLATRLWQIYVALSAICCVGLMALGMKFYDALTHAFTAVSTAGFSIKNESIAAYDSVGIEVWLMLFMVLGGISFMLYASLLQRRWNRWSKDEETRIYLWLLAGCTAAIGWNVYFMENYEHWTDALRASSFQTISLLTTTGYTTEDYTQWPAFSRVILVFLMLMGGCAGSTSGGFKLSRILLFLKFLRAGLIASFRPSQVVGVRINNKPADPSLKFQTMFFIALGFVLLGVGTAIISLIEPKLDLVSSFGTAIATLFNIGPGLGAVGPVEGFGHLKAATKAILCLFMILGRLEFITILVLFLPSFWRKY